MGSASLRMTGASPTGRGVRAGAATLVMLSSLSLLLTPLYAYADPPPQAPAHGFRAKAGDGTDVVFDRVFGAYAVPRQIRTYWSGDRFLRFMDGAWLAAPALAGPWELVASASVPTSLREGFPPPKERVRVTLPSGLALMYEPSLKVFAVVGQPDMYAHEGRFLRYLNGVWLVSARQEGPWELAPMKGLPVLLMRKVEPPQPGARVSLPSGPVLVYDAELAMFRVADKPDAYFHNGSFFEHRDSKWFRSARPDADFEEIPAPKIPAALRASYRRKGAADSPAKGEPGAAAKAPRQSKGGHAKATGGASARPARPPRD